MMAVFAPRESIVVVAELAVQVPVMRMFPYVCAPEPPLSIPPEAMLTTPEVVEPEPREVVEPLHVSVPVTEVVDVTVRPKLLTLVVHVPVVATVSTFATVTAVPCVMVDAPDVVTLYRFPVPLCVRV